VLPLWCHLPEYIKGCGVILSRRKIAMHQYIFTPAVPGMATITGMEGSYKHGIAIPGTKIFGVTRRNGEQP
jgi:hypothetical protein